MEISPLVQDSVPIRKFTAEPVDENALRRVLEAARLAPTPAHAQPHHIMVINTPEGMAKLKPCVQHDFEAPVVLVLCSRTQAGDPPLGAPENTGTVDTALVGTHIIQAARRQNLRAAWMGHFDPTALRLALELPLNLRPVALFPVGHPAPDDNPLGIV